MKPNKKYTFFNYPMFINAVKQMRVMCMVSFGILTLFTVLIPIGNSINATNFDHDRALPIILSVKTTFSYLYLVYMVITPFITLYLFSFLTKRNTSDYYHAFPQKRGCIFTTYFLVIASWLFVMVFGSGIISVIVSLFVKKYIVFSYITLIQFLLSIYCASLLVAASISIACQITGTIFTNIVVSGLIIFLPRMLLTIIIGIITNSSIIFVSGKIMPILDNKYNIVFNSIYSVVTDYDLVRMTSIAAIIYTFILAAIYFAAARVLYIKRKSEVSGNPSVNGVLQCVIRVAIALPICFIPISKIFKNAAGNASLDTSSKFWIIVCYIIAVILMLVYELISTKKFSKVKKAIPSIGILAAINIVVFIAILGIYNVEMKYTPAPEDIEYVKVCSEDNSFESDYFQSKMTTYKITDKQIIKFISDGLSNTTDNKYSEQYYYSNDDYKLTTVAIKSGFDTKYRNIVFSNAEHQDLSKKLMQCEDIKNIYTVLPEYDKSTMSINGDFDENLKKDLYNTLREEVKGIDFETWYDLLYNQYMPITINLNTIVDDKSVYANIPLTTATPKTLLKYLNYSNDNFDASVIDKCIKLNSDSNFAKDYFNFTVSTFSDNVKYVEKTYNYEDSLSGKDKFDRVINNIKENFSKDIKTLNEEGKKLARINISIGGSYSKESGAYEYINKELYAYLDADLVKSLQK